MATMPDPEAIRKRISQLVAIAPAISANNDMLDNRTFELEKRKLIAKLEPAIAELHESAERADLKAKYEALLARIKALPKLHY